MRRLALIAPLLVAVVIAPAAAFDRPITRRANLDADPARETVRVRPVPPPDAQTDFQRTQIRVADSCPAGDVNRRIAPVHDGLERLRLLSADLRLGKEVFLIMRDGARSVLGEVRLVAWREASGQPCRRPKALFRYDSDRHTRTPRGGNGDIASFAARIRDASSEFAGLEIAIDERFTKPSDPPSFGSLKKVTYWRYSPGRDRYVRYRTVQRELRPPG